MERIQLPKELENIIKNYIFQCETIIWSDNMAIEIKEAEIQEAKVQLTKLKKEVQTFMVGQEGVLDQILWTIFSGGHAHLEGLPGLGKTMLIRTIANVLNLSFSRIQFTPDLMPADITGTVLLQRDKRDNVFTSRGPALQSNCPGG